MWRLYQIFLRMVPVFIMIGLIPFISDDRFLTEVYAVIILISLIVLRRNRNDFIAFSTGFFLMTGFEYLFVSTGVELFRRHTLFGVMPLWLPLLWAYGFVAIKHTAEILSA